MNTLNFDFSHSCRPKSKASKKDSSIDEMGPNTQEALGEFMNFYPKLQELFQRIRKKKHANKEDDSNGSSVKQKSKKDKSPEEVDISNDSDKQMGQKKKSKYEKEDSVGSNGKKKSQNDNSLEKDNSSTTARQMDQKEKRKDEKNDNNDISMKQTNKSPEKNNSSSSSREIGKKKKRKDEKDDSSGGSGSSSKQKRLKKKRKEEKDRSSSGSSGSRTHKAKKGSKKRPAVVVKGKSPVRKAPKENEPVGKRGRKSTAQKSLFNVSKTKDKEPSKITKKSVSSQFFNMFWMILLFSSIWSY